MKRILILLLIALFTSCNTYYNLSNIEDIYLYNSPNKSDNTEIILIPAGTYYYTTIVKKRFRKAKYGNLKGYIYNPYFDNPYYTPTPKVTESYSSKNDNSTTKNNSTYDYSSTSYSRPKTVNVKGYYRKNGTYVSPHTRSAPRRK